MHKHDVGYGLTLIFVSYLCLLEKRCASIHSPKNDKVRIGGLSEVKGLKYGRGKNNPQNSYN